MLAALSNLVKKELYENVNRTSYSKHCLILYVTTPFRTVLNNYNHQNIRQTLALSRIIGEFGYDVDVVDYDNYRVGLRKKYDLIIDLHPGANDIYKEFTTPDCKKIAYITGSNPTFSNHAEKERIESLAVRKGVRLDPVRHVEPINKEAMESCDMVMFMGNEYNLKTFNEFNLKKVFIISNNGYEFLKNNDFSKKNPRNFLFLGGKGQVHKGLDLLLDVFSKNKDVNLYVCSLYRNEKDFCKLYERELFHSPNIIPVGFVSVGGKKLAAILKSCSYMLLPSCSEGKAGSVLTAMSAGLIPIVTRECGFEDDEVFHLEYVATDHIERMVVRFSSMDPDWIREKSEKTMELVNTRYSPKNYEDSVRTAMRWLLS
jgi:glycosyltransferase involved in cell wall biosynthesis